MSVFVTQPSLPPLEELIPLLEDIWESRQVSNMGKYHFAFERALSEYLDIEHINLFCNGTIALQTALQAMRISGEVITTPFSFAATTHAIYWNRCTPVFCDIDPETLTLDPKRIEPLITPQTTAILPVHPFGLPCDTEAIQSIADTFGLKVIYDAAPAFGVKVDGESLFKAGDLSIVSFHGTKVLNTFEGGAIFSKDASMKRRIDFLKNFGIADETTVVAPGSNGKMNEFQAALGTLQLQRFEAETAMSRAVWERYREALADVSGVTVIAPPEGTDWNYAYCPVLIDEATFGASRDDAFLAMKEQDIHPRRYYHPLISQFPSYRELPSADPKHLSVAERVTKQVLCLPIYPTLEESVQDTIIGILTSCGGKC